ncbi:hypothetical protein BDV19DRAFT_354338 [Aspergillus venezuelensis]
MGCLFIWCQCQPAEKYTYRLGGSKCCHRLIVRKSPKGRRNGHDETPPLGILRDIVRRAQLTVQCGDGMRTGAKIKMQRMLVYMPLGLFRAEQGKHECNDEKRAVDSFRRLQGGRIGRGVSLCVVERARGRDLNNRSVRRQRASRPGQNTRWNKRGPTKVCGRQSPDKENSEARQEDWD